MDPNGQYDATPEGLGIILYFNGRIVSMEDTLPNTYMGTTLYTPTTDPPWFSWSN